MASIDENAQVAKRVSKPTDKMKDYLQQRDTRNAAIIKNVRKEIESFSTAYDVWKQGIRSERQRLKSLLTEEELAALVGNIQELEMKVNDAFEGIRQGEPPQVPDQFTRQRMDSCKANSKNIILLAQARMSECDMEPWDDEAEQARLHNVLDIDCAKSLYSLRTAINQGSDTSIHTQGSVISESREVAAVNLATKRAELMAKEKYDKERARLRAELDKLDKREEIFVQEALVEALDKELGSINPDKQSQNHNDNHNRCLNPNAGTFVPQEDTLRVIQQSLDYNRLPIREPPIFSGNPIDFIKWKRSFEGLVGNKSSIRVGDKLALLEQYVSGEAAECIDGMFYRSDDQAYEDAWRVLNERFGHSSAVFSAFRQKLASWPRIGLKDYLGIQRFADFLVTLDHAMPHVEGLSGLNDPEENKHILRKLPDWIVTRWGSTVADYDTKGLPYPDFHKFAEFLATQAKIATRPICSLHALSSEPTPPSARHSRTTDVINQEPIEDTLSATVNVANMVVRTKECPFCQSKEHFLPRCETFKSREFQERRQFIVQQRRCFGCLRTGHIVKDCQRPHQCEQCGKNHPTALHDKDFRPREAVTHSLRCVGPLSATSLNMPVWISTKEHPHKEILVYALIDSQSDTTFVCQSLLTQLNPPSRDSTKLRISTLTDCAQEVLCDRISNLRVRGYNSGKYIDLPTAFSTDHIPLQKNSIPTTDTAKNWKHLQGIANQIPPLLDCEVGILIGFNCSRAFLPRDYITGEDTEPFAINTDLGWGIIGRTYPSISNPQSTCNRIVSKEAPSLSPCDAIRALESDFNNDHLDDKRVSQEDLQFLDILQKGLTRVENGHLQLPLPFKHSPKLPNNYSVAVKRFSHLKIKLTKNKNLHKEYTSFMEEVLQNDHAERVGPNQGASTAEWYIPHHGVMHPHKEKLLVVFDCSVRFQDTSLNTQLLPGPNLISSLVGILCRFRQHRVTVTCDVEKMFHQFNVNPEHRNYLRFLWWEGGDLTKQPSVFRMKVHLFGATSSPGCANYGLKYLATECEQSHPTGSQFIKENFYVDDGLTSVPQVEDAQQTIREAVEVCASGGLRLHKIASNCTNVLQGIVESERTSTTHALNPNTDVERTLGMQWSTKDDTIHFSLSFAQKPATRRGVLSTIASLYDPLGLAAPFIRIGKQIPQATCHKGSKWDEKMPPDLLLQWRRWESELHLLGQLSIPRCYYPEGHMPVKFQLHHFADASNP